MTTSERETYLDALKKVRDELLPDDPANMLIMIVEEHARGKRLRAVRVDQPDTYTMILTEAGQAVLRAHGVPTTKQNTRWTK